MRFGTDGVRGVANAELSPEYSLLVGRAAARVLGGGRFIVGRDTRRSGTLIEAAISAGLCSEGCDVELIGVVPTPAVAALSTHESCAAVMISASHNSFPDNGIKLFAAGGAKLSDEIQARIEAEIDSIRTGDDTTDRPTGAKVGMIRHRESSATEQYESTILAALEGRSLEGLSIVLDCANGSNSVIAAEVMSRAGANVTAIHAEPDGVNINEACGSTHPESLQASVVRLGADVGFAFDGDADRVLAVDRTGEVIDGDQLIAVTAIDFRERGHLRNNQVVITVMSNLGFRLGMTAAGIEVIETAVGDRYVLEALDQCNASLGGEQSGHIIFRDLATTGDGLLSALVVSDVVVRRARSLKELADAAMTKLPQVLHNVRMAKRPHNILALVADEVARHEAELGDTGRVLIRLSGTEPLVRVMVEAPDERMAARIAGELVDHVVSFDPDSA